MLDLMAEIEELRSSVVKKNIIIEKIKFHDMELSSDSDDGDLKKIAKRNRLQYYDEQL
jgi:hypothetical protein